MDESQGISKKREKPGMKTRAPLRRALKARLRAYYEFLVTQPIERFVILLRKR